MAVSNRLAESRFESYYVVLGVVADLSIQTLTITNNCFTLAPYRSLRNTLFGTPIYEIYYFLFEDQEPHSVLLLAPRSALRVVSIVNQLFESDESLDQSAEVNQSNSKVRRDDVQDISFTLRRYHMIKDGKLHICPATPEEPRQHITYLHQNDHSGWYP